MLSNALGVRHKPINTKKARVKRAEAQAQKQAPVPVEPVGEAEPGRVAWKQMALGMGAVGFHLTALYPLLGFYGGALLSWLLTGNIDHGHSAFIEFSPLTQGADLAITLSLLWAGWRFFRRQQRGAMLLSGLGWIILMSVLPHASDRAAWPYCLATAATLAAACVLGRGRPKPEDIE